RSTCNARAMPGPRPVERVPGGSVVCCAHANHRPGREAGGRSSGAMDALLQQLEDALGGVASDPRVVLGARVLVGYVVVLWLACALWAFVDMRRRSGSLVAPYVTATIVVLASPILFPLALLLHVVARPRVPIAERRLARLREAALESDVELPT